MKNKPRMRMCSVFVFVFVFLEAGGGVTSETIRFIYSSTH